MGFNYYVVSPSPQTYFSHFLFLPLQHLLCLRVYVQYVALRVCVSLRVCTVRVCVCVCQTCTVAKTEDEKHPHPASVDGSSRT